HHLIREEPCRWSIFREQRGSIYSLALSPDGRRIAVGGFGLRDGSAAIFDRTSHAVVTGITRALLLDRQQRTIWTIAFSDYVKCIAYGLDEGSVWLWDQDQAEPRRALRPLGKHPPVAAGTNKIKHIQFRDAGHVISVGEDGLVIPWDTRREGAEPKP